MDDKIRNLKSLFIILRNNLFDKNGDGALIEIEKIFNLLNTIKDIPIYSFMFACVSQIKLLVEDEQLTQALDLVDCIHVVPDILNSLHRDWERYWEVYVEEYMNRWGSLALLQFKDDILNLNKMDDSQMR